MRLKVILVALISLISAFSTRAYDFDFTLNEISYHPIDDHSVIIIESKMASDKVVIPSVVDFYDETYTVSAIKEGAFDGCEYLRSIVIPNSVTSIGKKAFANCPRLQSVEIPTSITEVSDSLFFNCSALTSLKIPDSVNRIRNSAFYGCSGLTSQVIPNSVTIIEEYAFYGCSGLLTLSIGNSVARIKDSAFYGCTGLTSLTIPNSVYRIDESAFRDCTGLTSLTIGLIIKIGDYAFSGCSGLTSLTIPNTVESIGNYAFYGCDGLKSVKIGNAVTSIGDFSFASCYRMTSVEIPNSVESIGGHAFWGCSGLTRIEIPNSVTSIGDGAFASCTGLVSQEIPNSVSYIGRGVFDDCDNLTDIIVSDGNKNYSSIDGVLCNKGKTTLNVYPRGRVGSYSIPHSITTIGDHAFHDCEHLTSVDIPNSVTTIGRSAFSYCHDLTNIKIPNSVISIGDFAFRSCLNMVIAEIPNSVSTIGEEAFEGCDKLKYLALGATGSNRPTDIMEIKKGAFRNTLKLECVCVGRMQYSLPQEDAFATDNIYNNIVVHKSFFVDDLNDDRYNCFSRYDCIRYGTFNDYTTQYNGLKPEFIPEFTSNLPQDISYSIGSIGEISNINAGRWDTDCEVSFSLLNPYSLQFSVQLPCSYVIERVPLHLNVKDCSRVYGEENPKFEIEVEGYVNGDREEIFSTKPKVINGIADWAPELPTLESPVGEYELVAMADFKSPQNYEISGSSHGILTITPAPLEISASTLTREYGQSNPEIELAYTGFKNDETEDALSAKPSITLEATTDSPVGEYPITISGAKATNYDISYRPGKLIISKANQSLSWDQTFANVRVGDEIQLNAISSSGLPIEYISSNPDIVLINENYAKFLAEGWSEITATQKGDENYLAASSISKRVDVLPMEVGIEEIIVNKEQISLSVGDTYQLTATIKPDNATHSELSWRSENSDIATVDESGLVKAIGKGKTTIIVESVHNPEVKAECIVDVDTDSNIEGIYNDGDIQIVVENKGLYIYNVPDDALVNIYSSEGTLIYSGNETHISLSSGVYIVKVGNIVKKIAI